MLEVFINEKFSSEKTEWRNRAKLLNYYQVASPEEFNVVNERSLIKLSGNKYMKKFNLIAN